MRYWVQLFTEFRTFTHTINNIVEAYNFYQWGKSKSEIVRGQIIDNDAREIFADFGYDE